MNYKNESIKNINIAYIGGGSRGWAWGFMKDLAMDSQIEGTVRLYDIDRAAAEKNKIIGDKISAHPKAVACWRYEVSATLEEALRGADVVVISILPGTFAEMRGDVHLPEQYGIWQSVGDTAGPGGFVRALRTIPMLVEIAKAIRDFAPKAWVMNYTNPMSLCMAALYHAFPQIRAFGCCHEVFGTQKLLAAMLEDMVGIAGVTRQEIKVNVLGINHFTWFDRANYQDIDLFPMYRQFAEKYRATGFTRGEQGNWMNDSFVSANRVKFDLFLRYGLIAAAGDRHLAEFTPEYLKDPQTVKSWMFGLTTVDWREDDLKKRLARSAALASGEEAIELEASGEEGHLLIKALLGLGDLTSNVNLPNQGQIDNLPKGAIVETNAHFRRGEVVPIHAGRLPDNLWPLISRHVDNHKNTLRAALECDYELALATFLNDPLVERLSPQQGDALLKAMLQNTLVYLPPAWKNQLM